MENSSKDCSSNSFIFKVLISWYFLVSFISVELPDMVLAANRLIEKLRPISQQSDCIDVVPLIYEATLEVFLTFNFGIDPTKADQETTELCKRI
jgi:hypothetical protein